jgi:hypothetical protein
LAEFPAELLVKRFELLIGPVIPNPASLFLGSLTLRRFD